MTLKCVPVSEDKELDAAFNIRREVFIKEQGIPEDLEFDKFDTYAKHFVVYDAEEIIGTARLLYGTSFVKIQRVAILSNQRKKGAGKYMMGYLLERLKDDKQKMILIDAQTRSEKFYQKFGFKRMGSEFKDCGIPHVKLFLKFE
jgi:predicted GNAT family N-acyltransferase